MKMYRKFESDCDFGGVGGGSVDLGRKPSSVGNGVRMLDRCSVCGMRLRWAVNRDLGIVFWNCFHCLDCFDRAYGPDAEIVLDWCFVLWALFEEWNAMDWWEVTF